MHTQQQTLAHGVRVYRFGTQAISTLVVHNDASVLIECHSDSVPPAIEELGLPRPTRVIHTHIQAEHTHEAAALPGVPVSVPVGLNELATDRDAFERHAATTWDDPEDWMNTMGAEAYGIAGATTYTPPPQPLNVDHELVPGQTESWLGLTWRVVALPGHMNEAVGLVLEHNGDTLACFIGDLMQAPGVLVNLYDLESQYGGTRLPRLPGVLRTLVEDVATDVYLPATGPAIENGRDAARQLAERIETFLRTVEAPHEVPSGVELTPKDTAGRFEQVAEGVWQMSVPCNAVLFVDGQGRGLMIDPGPCDYGNPEREAAFADDLVALEQHAGLKTIDQVLVTHMHGDHYDLHHIVQQRYPGCRLGAWTPLARLIERPEQFPIRLRAPVVRPGGQALRRG